MSAVKISEIQDGLSKLAFYFFSEAVSESKLETFKGLVKATNGFVYKQFGDETEITHGDELNQAAEHIKGWFDNVNEQQNSLIEKINNDIDMTEETEGIVGAKIAHISTLFIGNLTNYIISNYAEKIDGEGMFVPFRVSSEIVNQFKKDKDVKKMRENLMKQLIDHSEKNNLEISKSDMKKMISTIVNDIKERLKD